MRCAFFLTLFCASLCTSLGCTHNTNTDAPAHHDAAQPSENTAAEAFPDNDLPERSPLPDRKAPKVGTFCKNNADCVAGFSCETQVPEGYCTKFCNHTRECPLDSACARITFEGGFQLQRCIQTCRDERDCRSGFVCYLPPSSWDQICIPPTP